MISELLALREDYRNLLDRFPEPPPEPHPSIVRVEGEPPTFIEPTTGRPLPPEQQTLLAGLDEQRKVQLAVEWPLNHACLHERPLEIIDWRKRLLSVRRRLFNLYQVPGLLDRFKLLPLADVGDLSSRLCRSEVLSALDQQVKMLQFDAGLASPPRVAEKGVLDAVASTPPDTLVKQLREFMNAREISRKDIVHRLGCGVSHLSRVLSGKRPVSENLRKAIARVLPGR